MFDVGFSEMVVIAVVALIVIGPERLPKLARTIGHLIGRMNRYVADVKADINREMEVEELRKFKEQFQDAAQSVHQTIHQELNGAKNSLHELEGSVTGGPSTINAEEAAGSGPSEPLPVDAAGSASTTTSAETASPKVSAT